MFRILLPFDGSEPATRAVEHLIKTRGLYGEVELHLLNVQPSLPGTVGGALSGEQMRKYHQEAGEAQLAAARRLLDQAKVPYVPHVGVGDPAQTIARYCRDHKVDQVVMGTHGRSSIEGALLGSVASDLIACCDVPVLLVK
jgi:nucleotide-binding universal stress UspA family protein